MRTPFHVIPRLAAGLTAWLAASVLAIADVPQPPDRPFLWRVEGGALEKPSHLFGTIHMSNERIRQLHPAAEQAFAAADAVFTEISLDMADQMAGAMLMMRRDGKTLSEAIGPELTAQLEAQLKAIQPGLDITILQRMKTWAAAMMVVMLPHQLDGHKALDMILWERAKAAEKQTGGLEKIQDQVAAFETLNEEEQIIYLRETLDSLADAGNIFERLIAAYEAGDGAVLDALLTESMKLDGDDEHVRNINEHLIDALITNRDETLAEKIDEILRDNPGKSSFFAVGAAHFLGDHSIRQHLEAKGYTITRISKP